MEGVSPQTSPCWEVTLTGLGAGFQGGSARLKPGKGTRGLTGRETQSSGARGHQAADGRTRLSGPRAVLHLAGNTETEGPSQPLDSLSLTLHLFGGVFRFDLHAEQALFSLSLS